ncbi:MAG TPA: FkbM family methyltransferase [Candidatus Limnocylindrales bacterium]|nr:FkbM family methyltransferase [Candidatus Limnocylindrales bacterium]
MSAPFYRTFKQAKVKGFTKTVFFILAILLKRTLSSGKIIPEKSIVEVNDSKMLLYPKKGAIYEDLFLYKKREPLCTDYLIHAGVLKEGDTVLDIGANIGYYVLIESQLVGEKGKVYAVEPVCSNFESLEKNVQLNNLKNVSTFQLAFGEKDARSEIYVSNKSNWCAMNKDATGGKILFAQEVSVQTVDTFFKDRAPPDFIRMDVEGYEYQVIKGMAKTLKGNIKILIELHPWRPFLEPERMDELLDILEQNDFRAKFVVFENKVKENKIVTLLMKKAGDELPIVSLNMSIQELRLLIEENLMLRVSPNVIFEKTSSFCRKGQAH